MQVVANVDEADIGNVKVGQRVTFTVDAYPTDVFDGIVTQVRLNPTTTSNVVTYQVIVNAPNPALKLKPGLTANITIFTMEKEGIKTLPNNTFSFKPDIETMRRNGFTVSENMAISRNLKENEKIVWQQEDKMIRDKKVITGETDGINTEILSGLSDSDLIITNMKTVSQIPASINASSEKSPFMPQRPGSQKNTAKK